MTPSRTGRAGKGHYRFDRVFPEPVGRISSSSGTSNLKRFRALDQLLTELWDHGQTDALLQIKRGRRRGLAPQLLLQAKRAGRLGSAELLADVALRERLWDCEDAHGTHDGAVTRAIRLLATGGAGRRAIAPLSADRYAFAWRQVRALTSEMLPDDATVADLGRVPWGELWTSWAVADATKNRARGALSAILSIILGDKYHTHVRAIRAAIPILEEPENEREITPAQFWTLMKGVPEPAIASYVTLAASGLRVGAFLRTDHPAELIGPPVYGIKTLGKGGRYHVARVDPDLWEYVEAAVPCRIGPPSKVWRGSHFDTRYKRLYRWLRDASAATGIEATLHDLRRFFIQVGVDEVGEQQAQKAAGHRTRAMTQRYANRRDKGLVGSAVGAAIRAAQPKRKSRGKGRGTRRQRRPARAS